MLFQVADVKRVWSLHTVLSLVDLQNESSSDFKEMLRRCFTSQHYVLQPEVMYNVAAVESQCH